MRLICPNCSAEYEAPAHMVPEGGRHVQCSECHTRWFATGNHQRRLSEDQIIKRLESRKPNIRPVPVPVPDIASARPSPVLARDLAPNEPIAAAFGEEVQARPAEVATVSAPDTDANQEQETTSATDATPPAKAKAKVETKVKVKAKAEPVSAPGADVSTPIPEPEPRSEADQDPDPSEISAKTSGTIGSRATTEAAPGSVDEIPEKKQKNSGAFVWENGSQAKPDRKDKPGLQRKRPEPKNKLTPERPATKPASDRPASKPVPDVRAPAGNTVISWPKQKTGFEDFYRGQPPEEKSDNTETATAASAKAEHQATEAPIKKSKDLVVRRDYVQGITSAIVIFFLILVVYASADSIASAAPFVAPALDTFIAAIDNFRDAMASVFPTNG